MPAENIVVTVGSQQALMLISTVLLDPGDVVLVELPTYVGASSCFYARRADLIGVAQDEGGLVPESLDRVAESVRREGRRIKFLYTIPNFQNPSGRLLLAKRRKEVLEIAARHDFLIVEDDPYGELVYSEAADTTPIASASLDRIIYLGTFSKILSPGLRCGWITAGNQLLKTVELAKEAADLFPGCLSPSSTVLRGGTSYEQLNGCARSIVSRAIFIGALEKHFAGRLMTEALGGLFPFVT